VVTPDKIPAVAEGIGRTDLMRDPRFADPAKLAANMGQLTAILDEIFSAQPMAHWREVFDKANVPYGLVRDPHDVIKDPQLGENGIVVPLAGAGRVLDAAAEGAKQQRQNLEPQIKDILIDNIVTDETIKKILIIEQWKADGQL
jgi:crotonobetainyl-CoA:carnitine CoA-transferase CaiB-like acyl-CoA transferase